MTFSLCLLKFVIFLCFLINLTVSWSLFGRKTCQDEDRFKTRKCLLVSGYDGLKDPKVSDDSSPIERDCFLILLFLEFPKTSFILAESADRPK